jgi:hypothetical protein
MRAEGSLESGIACHDGRENSGLGVKPRNRQSHSKYDQSTDKRDDGDEIISLHGDPPIVLIGARYC